jgi:outer membrane protein
MDGANCINLHPHAGFIVRLAERLASTEQEAEASKGKHENFQANRCSRAMLASLVAKLNALYVDSPSGGSRAAADDDVPAAYPALRPTAPSSSEEIMMNVSCKPLLILLATMSATPALAYDKGNTILRVGPLLFAPDVSTDAGTAGLDVEDNVQLGLTATYMLHPNFGAELVAATPFYHDIESNGTTIGSTKHLPPTVFLQWYPNMNDSVQPFLGIGVNHTFFFDEKSVLGDLSLDESTGIGFEAGVDWKLSDALTLNATVWKLDINTDVSVSGAPLGELELDPFLAMVGIGWKF